MAFGFGKRPKVKAQRPGNERSTLDANDVMQAEDAASNYIKQKGYTESSLEAVRRVAKRQRRRPIARIGNYEQEI